MRSILDYFLLLVLLLRVILLRVIFVQVIFVQVIVRQQVRHFHHLIQTHRHLPPHLPPHPHSQLPLDIHPPHSQLPLDIHLPLLHPLLRPLLRPLPLLHLPLPPLHLPLPLLHFHLHFHLNYLIQTLQVILQERMQVIPPDHQILLLTNCIKWDHFVYFAALLSRIWADSLW